MDISFLKNPILLAILAGALTYLYMYWEVEKRKNRNPKAKFEPISYTTPLIVGCLTLFITYCFFGNNITHKIQEPQTGGVKLLDNKIVLPKTKLTERMTEGFDSGTYYLLGRNAIKLPQTDVFIDLAKF